MSPLLSESAPAEAFHEGLLSPSSEAGEVDSSDLKLLATSLPQDTLVAEVTKSVAQHQLQTKAEDGSERARPKVLLTEMSLYERAFS